MLLNLSTITFCLFAGDTLIKKILKENVVPSIFSWKRNLNINMVQDARSVRQRQRELSQKTRQMTRRSNYLYPIVNIEDSDNNTLVEPILLSSNEDINHCINEVPICCEIEVTSALSLCNASVNQSLQKISYSKVNAKFSESIESQKKTFANVATQTFMKTAFTMDKLYNNPEGVTYYTDLESFDKLKLVLHSLGPAAYKLMYRYNDVINVDIEDQFLITVIKLRRAMPDLGLTLMFDISKKTVQNIVITWLNFMYCEWSEIDIWLSKDLIMYYMPSGFKQMYPSIRVIVDGTEFPISAPKFRQAAFSIYKNKTTLKVLVGATPGGLISHISPAYAGSVSDRAIVERSDLTTKCDSGDSIMTDRGFTV